MAPLALRDTILMRGGGIHIPSDGDLAYSRLPLAARSTESITEENTHETPSRYDNVCTTVNLTLILPLSTGTSNTRIPLFEEEAEFVLQARAYVDYNAHVPASHATNSCGTATGSLQPILKFFAQEVATGLD
eukprot:scaffold120994_cov26-Attheya_sp.AAC.1